VTAGHLVANREFALLRDVNFYELQYARFEFVAAYNLVYLLVEPVLFLFKQIFCFPENHLGLFIFFRVLTKPVVERHVREIGLGDNRLRPLLAGGDYNLARRGIDDFVSHSVGQKLRQTFKPHLFDFERFSCHLVFKFVDAFFVFFSWNACRALSSHTGAYQ